MMKNETTKPAQSLTRKAGRVMLIILSIFLACIISMVGVLLIWSYPGKPEPLVGKDGNPLPGGISEKIHVDINGIKQGMFIKSKDKTKPVLLYLHGGMPDYFLTEKYPTGLEDYFTVCWWEQRGSGISYNPNIRPGSVTLEQLISDTLEVTNYLRHRFGKEKIFLMGHSGGTFIGIQAASRAPELYNAYIGVAQISNQLKSEKLAYDYMLNQFEMNGNPKMARMLKAAPVTLSDGIPDTYYAIRDIAMHRLGVGTTRDIKSVIGGLFLGSLQCRDYTLSEKINTWRAKATSGVSIIWKQTLAADLAKQVPELKIPVYFLHGVYDYTCSYPEAKSYFDKLKAPVKGFYTFSQSAHSPIFEEPGKVQNIVREDILTGGINHADKN